LRLQILVVALGLVATDAHARRRKGPVQVTPAKKAEPAPRDLSAGGERKGGIELALGSLTAGVAALLVGRGAWELVLAKRTREDCAAGTTDDPTCMLDGKPGRGGTVAGSLSLAFAVPVAVASGFLFRHAVRTRRDYEKFHRAMKQTAVSPWLGRHGGGASLQIRF
jgi:hypothetical protein